MVFMIAAMIFSSEEDGIFGFGAKIVLSSSMEKNPNVSVDQYRIKEIPVGSLILFEYVPAGSAQEWYGALQEGDVLVFVYRAIEGRITIVHRIKYIEEGINGFRITLAGDNSDNLSTQTIDTADKESGNRIIGKVVYSSYLLGTILCAIGDPIFAIAILFIVLATLTLRKRERNRARLPSQNGGNYEKGK